MGTGCYRTGWVSATQAAANHHMPHIPVRSSNWKSPRRICFLCFSRLDLCWTLRGRATWTDYKEKPSEVFSAWLHWHKEKPAGELGVGGGHNTLLFYTFRDSETMDNRIIKLNLILVFESRNKQEIRLSKLDLTVCSSFNVSIKGKCRCTPTAAATSSWAERQTHRSLVKVSDGHAAPPRHMAPTRHDIFLSVTSTACAPLHLFTRAIKCWASINPLLHPCKHQDDPTGSCLLFIFTGHEPPPPAQTTYSANSVWSWAHIAADTEQILEG